MKISMGEKLKELRQQKQYTQENVANYIGKTKSFVCMYESDKRSPGKDTLVKLSALFGVSLDYLMGKEELTVSYRSVKEDIALDYKNYPIIPMYENADAFLNDDICGHASPNDLLPDHEDENEVFFIAVETSFGNGWALVTRNSQNDECNYLAGIKDGRVIIIPQSEKDTSEGINILGKVRSLTYLL